MYPTPVPHAGHFLSRLDRVSLPHVELALGLYRDEKLLRFILDRARPPEGAQRVAISLQHPERGPFIVVTRDGHFVTCLGEGMRTGDLPIITRGQLDAIAARAEELRVRMELAKRMAGEDSVHKLLRRVYDAGDALSREELVAVSALQPLYAGDFLKLYVAAAHDLEKARDVLAPHLRKAERLRPEWKEALRSYWLTMWFTGHAAVLAAMDGAQAEALTPKVLHAFRHVSFSWGAFQQGVVAIAVRGLWAAARIGKPLVQYYKRDYQDVSSQPQMFDAGLGLAAIALRHARLRAEIAKTLAAPAPAVPGEEKYNTQIQQLRKLSLSVLTHREEMDEAEMNRVQRNFGASVWMDLTAHLPEGAPYRYPRAEEVPDDLAMTMAVSANIHWQGDVHALLWMAHFTGWAARVAPERLYLPREAIRAIYEPWKVEHTVGVLRSLEKAVRTAPARPEGPTRNGPCPCGSGKKYKRCCAGKEAEPAG